MRKIPTILLILDGYGLGRKDENNAVHVASTPVLDKLFAECPNTTLSASGLDVGLPDGQIGNSEVGHTNIGAGRVVFQDLPRISLAIEDGSFFKNERYLEAMNTARENGKSLHLLGLLSDGGVHSHITHLFALIKMAKEVGVPETYVHAFLDGRDVPPKSGADFVKALSDKCAELGYGKIATIQGRFFGMDRDKRWDRLQKGYNAIVRGVGKDEADAVKAVLDSYNDGVTDEFVEPVICDKNGVIKNGDSVIFFNYRPDRAREITWALTGNLPDGHEMDIENINLRYVCTTQYDENLPLPIAFPPEAIENTLGEYLSSLGLTQLRIAETEKYAHVTFFFNGGVEKVSAGEDRILVESPKQFPTYDLIPEMSAREVTEKCCQRIVSGEYDTIICNLANCDMVGHTGVMDAAIKAVETVDECVGKIVAAAAQVGGTTLITADHGNADSMTLADGGPNTAHTTNPVPLIVVGANVRLKEGRLADLAPTLLELMGYSKPEAMTGNSLIIKGE
ncbi:MAG: 2,3-bisphosphoglycerate-independent phosphoglycerate mutase [Oscillospiraceae bacterium]|nr:2,3-bisphosphoglycerate-independent phosphoglycerate mutase [Oscillospiraceae bacterium]